MPVIEYESFKKYPQFKGLFVGGCVARGDGSSFRAMAHAHVEYRTLSPHKGWICVRAARRVGDHDKPSQLMLHELAHLISGQGHNDRWRETMKEIGGKVDYWYTKEYNKCRKAGYRPGSLKEAKECLKTIKQQNARAFA